MKLALSGFAIDDTNEKEVFSLLNKYNITNIEGVLNKIHPWDLMNYTVVEDYKKKLEDNGLVCESLQSLLFGCNINSLNERDRARDHLERVISYARTLGVKILVLGSSILRKEYNFRTLADLIWDLDHSLKDAGITLCIEPTAKYYGSEYWHSTDEIIEFLNKIRMRKNVCTMIDLHNIITEQKHNNNIVSVQLNNNIDWIEHIHISDLYVESNDYNFMHEEFGGTLHKLNYNGIVTYETSSAKNLEARLELFTNYYQSAFQTDSYQR